METRVLEKNVPVWENPSKRGGADGNSRVIWEIPVDHVDLGHIRNDVRPFLARKEEIEYFSKEFFLAALGHYFSTLGKE
jgi:hypothetical protein